MTTTYFTRIPFSHPLLGPKVDVSDQESMHKFVMSLFPVNLNGAESAKRSANGILYRIERQRAGWPTLLVQSSIAPTQVTEDPDGARVIEVTGMLRSAADAEYARIKSDVNAIRRPDGFPAQPVPEAQLSTWLRERFGSAISDLILRESVATIRKAKGVSLSIQSVTADVLINDHEEFHRLLVRGIGRAKAYGCGLILAQPIG